MNVRKLIGLVLIVVGVLALIYRGFDYTKEDTKARLGPVEFSVKQKERVSIPVWAGALAVAAGAVILVTSKK
jgi:drug/metabolite transporter (DMT)-like permease